jgi:hypothetical protein
MRCAPSYRRRHPSRARNQRGEPMSKMGEKEDPLEHILDHIQVAEHRANRAEQWMTEFIGSSDPDKLEIVKIACESVEQHMKSALKHLHHVTT